MTALEYKQIVSELSRIIVGKHFSRIRKVSDGIYRMKIGDTEIVIELGVRIHTTKYLEPAEAKDRLIEKIEKELDNAKLLSLEQINNDRVILFNFGQFQFVCEMFREGNLVLVQEGKTVCAHNCESWSDREIKVGSDYRFPKTANLIKPEWTGQYVVVSLMKLPLGKDYVHEVLFRAEIEERKPGNELTQQERERIERKTTEIVNQPKPIMYRGSAGNLVDFALTNIHKYEELEANSVADLNQAADEYYSNLKREDPKEEQLKIRLEKQKQRLLELEGEERQYRQIGDKIYENYKLIEDVIAMVRQQTRTNEKTSGKVKKIDKKEKSAEVEI